MTVKLPGRTAIEYCGFDRWEDADKAPRTILKTTDSRYYGAPQIFFFAPHEMWYLIYQVGVPGAKKMWVAYSTASTIADPMSWTQARPILDGGAQDPRVEGGLDYWIICDDQRAYVWKEIRPSLDAVWMRLRSSEDLEKASAWFHLAGEDKRVTGVNTGKFEGIARVGEQDVTGGVVHARSNNERTLHYAASTPDGRLGYYTFNEDMQLVQTSSTKEEEWLREHAAIPAREGVLEMDRASIIYTDDNGKRFRLTGIPTRSSTCRDLYPADTSFRRPSKPIGSDSGRTRKQPCRLNWCISEVDRQIPRRRAMI